MKSYILHYLSKLPLPTKEESEYDKIQRIGREICATLPNLVEQNIKGYPGSWIEVMHWYEGDEIFSQVADSLKRGFEEIGVRAMISNEVPLTLEILNEDLQRVAKIERDKSNAEFLSMMQYR